jgi:hypothetical protein
VKGNRRLVPFVLVAALTLGAWLGAGLGIAEGPTTVNGTRTKVAQPIRCTASVTQGKKNISCNSPSTFTPSHSFGGGSRDTVWFSSSTKISKGFTTCVEASLRNDLRHSVGGSGVSASLASCEGTKAEG